MVFIKYGLAVLAIFVKIVQGQVTTSVAYNFDTCECNNDLNDECVENSSVFDDDRKGSQLRTYGNLCGGSLRNANDDDGTGVNSFFTISSRVGDPFRSFCGFIDQFPNVVTLMARGNTPHTVFAPPDSAFAKVSGLLDRIPTQKMIELHILPQARMTSDLRCGQTYRTLNTEQDRSQNQRSLTRCVNAFQSQQLGPGNLVNAQKPTIGIPNNVFIATEFTYQREFVITTQGEPLTTTGGDQGSSNLRFSQNVMACNGIIQVVDNVLLPGNAAFDRPSSGYYGIGKEVIRAGGYYSGPRPGPGPVGAYYGVPAPGAPRPYYGIPPPVPGRVNYYGPRPPVPGRGYYYGPPPPKGWKGGKGGKGSKGKGFGKGFGGKGFKKEKKGGKGYKGGKKYGPGKGRGFVSYYGPPPPPLGVGWRDLEESDETDTEFESSFRSDADFFGVEERNEREELPIASDGADAENLRDRKRRLESLLIQPDGNLVQA